MFLRPPRSTLFPYTTLFRSRDLLRTLEDIEERQRIAAAQGDDTDVLAYYAEPPLVAANLFHLRGGRVVDRREFYWEDLEELDRKSTRLNSSHANISYAVFCL